MAQMVSQLVLAVQQEHMLAVVAVELALQQ